MALSVAMGIAGVVLSVMRGCRFPSPGRRRAPRCSRPRARRRADSPPPSAPLSWSGVLSIAAGLIKPFARLIAAIPYPLANAMLAGVLFGLCLKPIAALTRRRSGRP